MLQLKKKLFFPSRKEITVFELIFIFIIIYVVNGHLEECSNNRSINCISHISNIYIFWNNFWSLGVQNLLFLREVIRYFIYMIKQVWLWCNFRRLSTVTWALTWSLSLNISGCVRWLSYSISEAGIFDGWRSRWQKWFESKTESTTTT